MYVFPPDKNTAHVRYHLAKQYKLLETAVSIHDVSNGCTPLTFTVFGDGRKLWESKPVSSRKERQDCTIDVAGVDVLELSVTCPGPKFPPKDDIWAAHAVWIDPILRR